MCPEEVAGWVWGLVLVLVLVLVWVLVLVLVLVWVLVLVLVLVWVLVLVRCVCYRGSGSGSGGSIRVNNGSSRVNTVSDRDRGNDRGSGRASGTVSDTGSRCVCWQRLGVLRYGRDGPCRRPYGDVISVLPEVEGDVRHDALGVGVW